MRKLSYLVVLEPSEEGYGVYFSDLPGCISYGNSIEEARKNATEALELHVYGMEKDGDISGYSTKRDGQQKSEDECDNSSVAKGTCRGTGSEFLEVVGNFTIGISGY